MVHDFCENDVIVLGSDGLFDNLYSKDFEECIKNNISDYSNKSLKKTADCLA